MADKSIIIVVVEGTDLSALEGRTFQVHGISGTTLKLYPVVIHEVDTRCPAYVGGERCGLDAGHDGRHCWGGGD